MTSHQYRFPRKGFDIGFVFGALGASALPGPVLLVMLDALGTAESAARNALTTMAHRGMLTAERQGRYTVYALAGGSLARYEQLAGSATEPHWTGRFHALIYDVPERHRALRDRIRYVADAAGYGLLRPGLLISPDDRRDRLTGVLGSLPAGCRMYTAAVEPTDLAEARRMTRDAWDLDVLAERYRTAETGLRAVDRRVPETWQSGLARWSRLYAQLTAFQLSDPWLSRELLPSGWPRSGFREALDELNRRWAPRLQPQLRAAAASVDPGGLAVYLPSPWSDPG